MTDLLLFFVYWAMVLTPCLLGLYFPVDQVLSPATPREQADLLLRTKKA